jgi:hypothetical protein
MTGKTGVFVLDADMVLLDLVGGFGRWLSEAHGIFPACPFEMETLWNMPTMYPGMDVTGYLSSFISAPDWFSRMPLMSGSRQGVSELRRLLPDHRMRRARIHNLLEFQLDEVITLPFQGCKAAVFGEIPEGAWVVDDAPHNVEAALHAGHRAVLFEHGYNRSFPWPERVSSWPDLVDLVAASVSSVKAA